MLVRKEESWTDLSLLATFIVVFCTLLTIILSSIFLVVKGSMSFALMVFNKISHYYRTLHTYNTKMFSLIFLISLTTLYFKGLEKLIEDLRTSQIT
jgi:hypothetical protein